MSGDRRLLIRTEGSTPFVSAWAASALSRSAWHRTCASVASPSRAFAVFLRLLFLVVAAMLAYHFTHRSPAVPLQSAAGDTALQRNGYRIVPLEPFAIEATVLSAKRYRFDRESDLAPVDLALGWGPMANPAVSRRIAVSQSDRWYYWRVAELPIPQRDIETHSANMHMIPATRDIEDRLEALRIGDVVRLKGYLVEAWAPDGWRWRSSLSRADTGAGACEVVWVEQIGVR